MFELAVDTAAMPATSQAEAPAKRAAKARLLSLADLDSRTRAARIVTETRDRILEDLGGADRLTPFSSRLRSIWRSTKPCCAIWRCGGLRASEPSRRKSRRLRTVTIAPPPWRAFEAKRCRVA